MSLTKLVVVSALLMVPAVQASTVSNAIFAMTVSDGVSSSSPGDLVTYSVTVTNNDSEGRELFPFVVVDAGELEIPNVSDHGRRSRNSAGKPGGSVKWNELGDTYQTGVLNKKSHTFTFSVKTPTTIDDEYCVSVSTFGLPLLELSDCNAIVAPVAATPTPSATVTPTPTATPTVQPTTTAQQSTTPPPSAVVKVSPSPTPPINPDDFDGDGLPNDQEALYGSDPNTFDTDGDGRPDGLEVREGSSPVLPHNPNDFDNDGVPDSEEELLGTNSHSADTDGDGILDGEELRQGSNPLIAGDDGENSPFPSEDAVDSSLEPSVEPVPEVQSFWTTFGRVITRPFRVFGNWVGGLF